MDRFLFSTRYKPDAKPTEENLRQIVEQEALARMAVLEAKRRGLDRDSTLVEKLQRRLDRVLYRLYVREEIIDAVITDSLIREFYRNYSPQYRMKYILRAAPEGSPKRMVKAQEDTIWMIYRSLQRGETFEELAKRYSQDVISAPKGGDLGWMIRESMGDPKLRAVMDTLTQYTYSRPFRGMAGFYILYKGDQRDVPVPPLEEVRDRIWRTLYRTRKYLVEREAERRMQELAATYHYRVDSAAVKQLLERAAVPGGAVREIDPDRLREEDLQTILARYDGGAIRAAELFADRKKRPEDEWEFWRALKRVARERLFALDARAKGYLEREDVQKEKKYIWDALLKDAIYEIDVRRPVAAKLDSVREHLEASKSSTSLRILLTKKRHEFETARRERLESELKRRYHFRFLAQNFDEALSLARKRKAEARAKSSSRG